ncbi:PepSY-associated TM helix domain-containing protein [Novosphingobium resinovorum]|uniref:PepSY-associated TM helix domain-containing protein n=1 Tax=Novosphingobium resinovorum TaxID=158500 RepID=UPI002ED13F27|nr:PepSY-associated TM helix domain-containing protein [Novosphingobium resinovorum]
MRAGLVLCHRYVGLTIAGFLVIASLTGSLIVFRAELDALLNPELFRVQVRGAPMLGYGGIARAVENFDPDVRAGTIVYARHPGESAQVVIVPRTDAPTPRYNQLFVDPYSGAILGQRTYGAFVLDRPHLMPFLHRFHYTLMMPANAGVVLLGIVALLWMVDCFVAFILTLPRGRPFWRKWLPAWGIKRKSGSYRLNLDLHRASGLWLWPILFLLALTSVAVSLEQEIFRPVLSALLPTSEEPVRPEGIAPDPDGIGFDGAIAAAAAEARRRGWEAEPSVAYLIHTRHVFGVRFGDPRRPGFGVSVVFVDLGTGRILRVDKAGTGLAGDKVAQLMLPIHTGRVAGLPGRIMTSVAGMVIVLLCVTGIVIWWKKRAPRVARRRKVRTIAPRAALSTGDVNAAE